MLRDGGTFGGCDVVDRRLCFHGGGRPPEDTAMTIYHRAKTEDEDDGSGDDDDEAKTRYMADILSTITGTAITL